MTLREAIETVPEEHIARFLFEKGIRGSKYYPSQCPIANYLTKVYGDFVGCGATMASSYGIDKEMEMLPEYIVNFIVEFDHGVYPELEETNVESV